MGSVKNLGTSDRPRWCCRYLDSDGQRKNRATHQTTKAAALRYLAEIEARIARGLLGIPEESIEERQAKSLTVGDLAQRFLNEYDAPRLKNRDRYMSYVRPAVNARLLPYPLASLAAVKVKKIDVVNHRDALRKKYKPATVNLTLSFLARIYSWAIDSEIIDCRNPCRVEKMPAPPSEQRYTREHCERLLGPNADPRIATALFTGMRRGELLALRWDCVRFELGCIEIKRSFDTTPKSGKSRTIPLHSELAPILRSWQTRCPPSADGLCFPVLYAGEYKMVSRATRDDLRAILVAAGCPGDLDRPWHAMRHTFATLLAESGASFEAVSRILGHSTGGSSVTAGYVHTSLRFLATEIEKLRLLPSQPAAVLRLADFRQQA